jgi:plasmid stability protein
MPLPETARPRYTDTIMAPRQVALRLDEELAEQLKLRAAIEHRSVNEIITEAIREYAQSHPIPRKRMLEMVRAIVKEDATLLQALADA